MCHYGQIGLEHTPNKSQHLLNLEKSILQRERVFFPRLCGCLRLSCCCMSQTSVLNACLVLAFGDNLITLDYAAQFYADSCNLKYFVLISSFMDILPVRRVLVAFSSLEMTLG